MKLNPLTLIDFYKVDHRSQMPENTELVVINLTPRKSRIEGINEIVYFGGQYFVKEYLIDLWNNEFFKKPKKKVIKKYMRRIEAALGKGCITSKHLEALHDLGYLPLEIMALPEGSLVPMRCACLIAFNTHKDFYWLPGYFETIMSCVLWGPCTSATTMFHYKKILTHYADLTVGNRDFVQWQGHDFSFRGMFGVEAAYLSGAAALLSSTGTDSVPAIDFLEEYYFADCEKELIAGSVPATEHSVMCLGTVDGEIETFDRLITKTYPKGIVSIVSDTWDFWKVITEFLPTLKEKILARDGKVVIRPDSGDPVKIICGDKHAPVGTPEYKGAVECMWEIFGGTMTEKGFKLLDSHIGLIYGDSITPDRCKQICQQLMEKGFCSYNIVLGIGSYTYQFVTRDTFSFAVKATYAEVGGVPREIYKDPKTDSGMKKSAKGLLAVYKSEYNNTYEMKDQVTWEQVKNCEFKTIFKDGKAYNLQTLSQIRERLASYCAIPELA